MKIAIGSDKSGFSAKEAIKAWLTEAGVEFDDLGTTDLEQVHPYYQVASEVAPLVQNGSYDKAVLICGDLRSFLDNFAHLGNGIHIDACLCGAHIDAGANTLRGFQCFGNGIH